MTPALFHSNRDLAVLASAVQHPQRNTTMEISLYFFSCHETTEPGRSFHPI